MWWTGEDPSPIKHHQIDLQQWRRSAESAGCGARSVSAVEPHWFIGENEHPIEVGTPSQNEHYQRNARRFVCM